MTTTEETEIWPVPEGTLMVPALTETLEMMGVAAHHLGPLVLDLIAEKPERDDADREAWVHDLAVLVDGMESIIDLIREAQTEAAEALARAVPYEISNVTFSDTRALTPRWPKDRKAWQNDRLRDDVRARVLADENGEARPGADVFETLESIVSIIGSNVKTTGLKKLGLDPDDYCMSEKRPPTVQVVKEKGKA